MIKAVRRPAQQVLWVCDPMHGNTETSSGGLKTRRFENIQRELELSFQIHEDNGSFLGGVHIELTGEDVTECTGGARGLTDADLARAYRSTVDPRLNYEQALELAMLIGRHGAEALTCSTSTSRFPKTASASPSIRTRRSTFRTTPSSPSSKATGSASTSRR